MKMAFLSQSLCKLRDAYSRNKRAGSWAFLAVGLALLIYVGMQYVSMYSQQRRLAREWERQNSAQAESPLQTASVEDQLTRLSIPRINLDAVVVEGTSRKQLAIAPGHLEHTSYPGEAGNTVISAHRDTFFRHIYELQKGDDIVVRRNGKVYHYEVTGKKIVDPDDMAVVHPSKDAQLTLLTCYPTYYIGPAPERLVIFSKLVEPAAAQSAPKAVAVSAHGGN